MEIEADPIIHENRVEALRALHTLGGTASLREVFIYLEKNSEVTLDLPSILYTFQSLDSLVTVSERDNDEDHPFEGLPPHDVTINEDSVVETCIWAANN